MTHRPPAAMVACAAVQPAGGTGFVLFQVKVD